MPTDHILPFGITAANVITWVLFCVVQIGGIFLTISRLSAKFVITTDMVERHHRTLYTKEGDLNVVTFTAAGRIQKQCSDTHTTEEHHLKELMETHAAHLTSRIKSAEEKVEKHKERTSAMIGEHGECLAVLQSKLDNACRAN